MQVEVVDTNDRLEALRSAWDTAYAVDPYANVFLSWSWLRGWLEVTPQAWQVLVAKPPDNSEPVAFLPIASSVSCWGPLRLSRELSMAGKPFADYSGMVSAPQHADAAIAALGAYIRDKVAWDRFRIAEVVDPRFAAFLAGFNGRRFQVRTDPPLFGYYIALPETWDEFTQDFMSSNARYNITRGMRKIEELEGFRMCNAQSSDVELHLQSLLGMWQARWGERHEGDLERYRHMFRHALAHDQLWLRTIWVGDAPVASLVGFLDRIKKSFFYYISGFNPRFARYSPGKMIVGYAIRDAIEEGYREFDLLLGDEAYKREFFGASPREAHSATISRRSLRTRLSRRLNHWRKARLSS